MTTTFTETTGVVEGRKGQLVEEALSSNARKDSVLDGQKKELEETLVNLLTCREALNFTASLARETEEKREEESGHEQRDVMLMCKQLKAIMVDLEKIDFHRSVTRVAENDRLQLDAGDYLRKIKKKIDSGAMGEKILKSEMDGEPDIIAEGEGLRRCTVGDETSVSWTIWTP